MRRPRPVSSFDPVGALQPVTRLLEASAGTGKTFSITNLVLRLVAEQGLGIAQVLVVTFTEAATSELRDRIRLRLGQAAQALERAAMEPSWAPASDDLVLEHLVAQARAHGCLGTWEARLRQALEGFDEAAISTIHGFCLRMLQQNAFESGVEFDTELVTDAAALVHEAVEDFYSRELYDQPPFIVRYLQDHCGLDKLKALARKALSDADLELIPSPQGLDPAATMQQWTASLQALRKAWACSTDAPELIRQAALSGHLHRGSYKPEHVDDQCSAVDRWLQSYPQPLCSSGVQYFSQAQLAKKTNKGRDTPRHPLFERVDELLDAEKRIVQSLVDRALTLQHELVTFVRTETGRRKRDQHQHTFDDLLRSLRAALVDPGRGEALRGAIRRRFRAALIDEFQDTDPVQWEIFREAFHAASVPLILIGDPKQAIYDFRGADVFAYLDAQPYANVIETLDRNYRSDGALVRAINCIFGKRLTLPFIYDGIAYGEATAVHDSRLRLREKAPAALQIRLVPQDDDDGPMTKDLACRLIPGMVAGEIRELLDSSTTLLEESTREWRTARPRDVAVLVRTNSQARDVQGALRSVGIPSVLSSDSSVIASGDAQELCLILQAVLEPTRLQGIRAALSTRMLGMCAHELCSLDEQESAWDQWVERFRAWNATWIARGFMPMIRTLIAETQMLPRLLGHDDGERRVTNVVHLAELLHAAAHSDELEPAGLLAWLRHQRLAEGQKGEEQQLRLESDADAVEIVTMHRSKGLQYPLVWCPYLWDGILLRHDEKRLVRFHHEKPDGGRVVLLDVGLDTKSERKQNSLQKAQLERQAENLRLAYVAMTRAKHRCTVYWGRFRDGATSPLGYMFHQAPSAEGDLTAATKERVQSLESAQMLAELAQLARASEGTIEVVTGPPPVAVPISRSDVPAVPLRAREFERGSFDLSWRRASFSHMTHGAHAAEVGPEAEGKDRDPAPEGSLVPTDASCEGGDGARAIIALDEFPRGTRAGTAVHRILELLDFQEQSVEKKRALVYEQLRHHGLDADRWAQPLTRALDEVLATPLNGAGTMHLGGVSRRERLNELVFEFPLVGGLQAGAGAISAQALGNIFRAHGSDAVVPGYGDWVDTLGFLPVRGFMTGSIDLAFRHEGRWFIVDYKSNHLGSRFEDYLPAALKREMAARHYYLQYHLYAVALHRYLGWRLSDYNFERHFGGVAYLFLRGMRQSWGTRAGVFLDRPSRSMIEGLSRLMDGNAGGAR